MPAPERFTGKFNAAQTAQLLAPIKPHRVLTANGQSHVSQQDVVAHLTRVFGFGNWCTDLVALELVFETPRAANEKEPWKQRWDVCYRAVVRLTIFDEYHNPVCYYEDGSMGDAQNQVRHDAHDLAMKSAISTALKRCAKNLGDQWGLSLYNKGQQTALVGGTLVKPDSPTAGPATDLQEHASEQVSMGDDETEKGDYVTEEQAETLASSLGATKIEEETA
jgi:recombination DNA repair RAD52 pathway protein